MGRRTRDEGRQHGKSLPYILPSCHSHCPRRRRERPKCVLFLSSFLSSFFWHCPLPCRGRWGPVVVVDTDLIKESPRNVPGLDATDTLPRPPCRWPGERDRGHDGYVPPCRPPWSTTLPRPFASGLRSRSRWPFCRRPCCAAWHQRSQVNYLAVFFTHACRPMSMPPKTWGRFRVAVVVGGCPRYHSTVPFSPRFNLPSPPPAELQNSLARPFDPSAAIPFAPAPTPASGSCLPLVGPMHIPQSTPTLTHKHASASASCRDRC